MELLAFLNKTQKTWIYLSTILNIFIHNDSNWPPRQGHIKNANKKDAFHIEDISYSFYRFCTVSKKKNKLDSVTIINWAYSKEFSYLNQQGDKNCLYNNM